ncbi:TatD family nuclease-associated radical SAM protein [Acetobacterium tundrae]|uniref:Radical SAM protein n=1 Tax=Acetobacterium tundrae TaxID=132932 RepID=A0ABR6WMR1_9FIRM|nr:TatD family nuclease-associated radical SAM protein [Acetobacterium tundrae]MBC3797805.1 radical SAM protein [Acetobacterium tundrae]
MTITYELGKSLYVNMTNRCSNACTFCIRRDEPTVNGVDDLWLEKEPTKEEVLEDILKRDLSQYKELVFCGYGEPSYRLDEICEIAKEVKKRYPIPTRLNTNGHGNLIFKKDMTPYLKDAIDVVSISLNAKDKQEYNTLCRPVFEDAYEALLDFARLAGRYTKVVLTIVDILPEEDQEACRRISKSVGADLRIRSYIDVG